MLDSCLKGTPKMVKQKLDGKTRPRKTTLSLSSRNWGLDLSDTFHVTFLATFLRWRNHCLEIQRVVPQVEQNDVSWIFMMFLYPVAKPKSLFTGFPPLGSFLLAQKFTALRMTPSALAGIPSHLLRNAAAYSFAMLHEHHSKPFAAAPFPFGGSAFGSGAWRNSQERSAEIRNRPDNEFQTRSRRICKPVGI